MAEMSESIPRERLARNVEQVRARMREAAVKAHRPVDAVKLIAVTKTVGLAEVLALHDLGVRDFGESRIQDAERKIRTLAAKTTGMDWHLIGHLQTNKADKAARLFATVHSVDSSRVAEALNKERLKASLLPPLPCLLEVNAAGEAQKFGLPAEASGIVEMLRQCTELSALKVVGLMCMAPYSDSPEATSRPVFRRLRELLGEVNRRLNELPGELNSRTGGRAPLTELSMGMTQDYAIAIEEGATMVRVGTALFE